MKILPLTSERLPELTEAEQRCFPGEAWSQTSLEQELSSLFFVAEEGDETVGYCIVRVACGEAELLRLAVLPSSRRRGIGRALLEHTLAQTAADRCFLEVREGNAAAIALYERVGFTPIAERRNYYRDGETAVIMKKELGTELPTERIL